MPKKPAPEMTTPEVEAEMMEIINRLSAGARPLPNIEITSETVQEVDEEGNVIGEIGAPLADEIDLVSMFGEPQVTASKPPPKGPSPVESFTGGSSDYYKVFIEEPTSPGMGSYVAECNDIIEALGMNFAEGNAFKAIWRRAAARSQPIKKKGYDDGTYDAEKVVFFGERMVVQSRRAKR